jgi:hypothetical protein
MSEQYKKGTQRIFYKSAAFQPGLNVTAVLLDRYFNIYTGVVLTEVEGMTGIYYFNYTFNVGEYVIVFSENGKQMTTQVYQITDVVQTSIKTANGNKLINT